MIPPILWQRDFFSRLGRRWLINNETYWRYRERDINTYIHCMLFITREANTEHLQAVSKMSIKFFFLYNFTTFSVEWGRNQAIRNFMSSRVWTSQPYPKSFSSLGRSSCGEWEAESTPSEALSQSVSFFSMFLPYMQELHHLSTETVTSTGLLCWFFSCPGLLSLCSKNSTRSFTCSSDKPIISTLFIANEGFAKWSCRGLGVTSVNVSCLCVRGEGSLGGRAALWRVLQDERQILTSQWSGNFL